MARNTITLFGRLLRVLRVENDEILYNMAQKLGIASSYLSMIETGVRTVPSYLLEKIRVIYSLDENRYRALSLAIEDDRNKKRGLSVVLDGLHEDDLAYVAFAEKHVISIEYLDDKKHREGDVNHGGLQIPYHNKNGRDKKRSMEKTRA